MSWKKNLRENKSLLRGFRIFLPLCILSIILYSTGCETGEYDIDSWSGSNETGYDFANDITSDGDGNAFIIGHTSGRLDGSVNQGGMDIFLAKYDATSSRQWVKHLASDHNDRGTGVVVNQSGDIFVAGYTYGDMEGHSNQGSSDILWMKYNADGELQWLKQSGGDTRDQATALAIDNSGNIFITGRSHGNLHGESSNGNDDAFIIKSDSSGNIQWTKLIGSSGSELSNDIAIDESGDILIVGWTDGSLEEDNLRDLHDIFLAKYDSSGDQKWIKQLGTDSKDFGQALAVDASNDIFITGYTYGDLDGESGGNIHRGASDIFLAKYDSSGDQKWIKQLGTAYDENSKSISIDSSGDIVITGRTLGSFPGNAKQGSYDLFIIKIEDISGDITSDITADAGGVEWIKQAGTVAEDSGTSISIDASNDILATGQTYGDLDGAFNKGHSDIFLLKYNPLGETQ